MAGAMYGPQPVGFGVAVNAPTFENTITQLPVGGKSAIKSIQDVRKLKRPFVYPSQGTDEDFYTMAVIADALGFQVKAVTGYEGNILGQGFEYGSAFVLTAGLMNLLLVLDALDIAHGKKD